MMEAVNTLISLKRELQGNRCFKGARFSGITSDREDGSFLTIDLEKGKESLHLKIRAFKDIARIIQTDIPDSHLYLVAEAEHIRYTEHKISEIFAIPQEVADRVTHGRYIVDEVRKAILSEKVKISDPMKVTYASALLSSVCNQTDSNELLGIGEDIND